jgi:sodium/potassium-transporting ATPase subunit alpha
MSDYGFAPHVLPGLGAFDNWGKQLLFCKTTGGLLHTINTDGSAAVQAAPNSYVNNDLNPAYMTLFKNGYVFWEPSEDGELEACEFAPKNFKGSSDKPGGFTNDNGLTYGTYTSGSSVNTLNSYVGMMERGYMPYMPWRSVESPFFNLNWASWKQSEDGLPGTGRDADPALLFAAQLPGVFVVANDASATDSTSDSTSAADDVYKVPFTAVVNVNAADLTFGNSSATAVTLANGSPNRYEALGTNGGFYQPKAGQGIYPDGAVFTVDAGSLTQQLASLMFRDADGTVRVNALSRMMQKEALHHAQASYFVAIVILQWADLIICKTRWLSIYHQGMRNPAMNFGLLFETILACFLCYVPGVDTALGTRPLRLLHWVPAVPFSICIVLYDEVRKYLMRTRAQVKLQGQQQLIEYDWIGRNTYY